MKDPEAAPLDSIASLADIDVGRPVEWMVHPDQPDAVLGVTYAFSQTGARKTVWYTANKRRVKVYVVVTKPPI